MAKKNETGWKGLWDGAILLLLCFSLSSLWAAEEKPSQHPAGAELELQEVRMARQAAELKCAELRAALSGREQELEDLRRRYADLYLTSRRQQQELEYFELRVAGMLADRQDLASGQALSRVVALLDEFRTAQQDLCQQVFEFRTYLTSILDILQPSETLRREVTERYAGLVKTAERSVRPLSSVAGRGSASATQQDCRVLAVNDELQVVVLNQGSEDGVRQGTRWRVLSGERAVATLRIAEVRSSISAAVVTDGRLSDIAPGALARPGE